MSLILEAENNRIKCQKFTPLDIVEIMLDIANYKTDLMGKKVLENSFGSGNILKSIVKRYIVDSLGKGILPTDIARGLELDVYGVELDEVLYSKCINDLNKIIKEYRLPSVKWSLYNEDTLEWNNPILFNFIIGNPPYISYRFIDEDNRKKLKNKYISCSCGKFDYCYAFIESAINMLSSDGKLVQLIPSNIYKNVFANNLRNILKTHIVSIREYPNIKFFGSTLTSSSIFLYDKYYNDNILEYKNVTENQSLLLHKNLFCEKWIFKNNNGENKELCRFGDYFHASVSVATQLNKAFLITNDYSLLEKNVLKKAASPRNLRYGKNELIIFPYYYDENGKLRSYSEEVFYENFPLSVNHLLKYKDQLIKRKADLKAKWFEYGRSQALAHLNQEKLLLSTIVTNKLEIYKLDTDTIPYSGIFIVVKNKKYNLDDAIKILTSDDFFNYINVQGISVSGKSKRITCKDINNYKFLGD